MRVAIAGPAEPEQFSEWLDPTGTAIPRGLGGQPVNQLVRELLLLGHSVSLHTLSPHVKDSVTIHGSQLDVHVHPYRRARRRALDGFKQEIRHLALSLQGSRADIVHAHWTYEFALAALQAWTGPLLLTAHDSPRAVFRSMPDLYRLRRLQMARKVAHSHATLSCVTPYLAKEWMNSMRYRGAIPVVPNPVPPIEMALPSRPTKVILDVSNGSRLKNVDTLLKAFSLLAERHPDAQLRLIGPGLEPTGALARRERRKHPAGKVMFLGMQPRERVLQELGAASVFCHPSLEESHGIALVEALQSGLVVIGGAQSGAVPWTLFDGRAGFLTDVNSPLAVAESIGLALDGLRPPLVGSALQQQLVARYEPRSVALQYSDLYRSVIAGMHHVEMDG